MVYSRGKTQRLGFALLRETRNRASADPGGRPWRVGSLTQYSTELQDRELPIDCRSALAECGDSCDQSFSVSASDEREDEIVQRMSEQGRMSRNIEAHSEKEELLPRLLDTVLTGSYGRSSVLGVTRKVADQRRSHAK